MNTKNGFAGLAAVIIIAIVLIGGGATFYVANRGNSSLQNQEIVTDSALPSAGTSVDAATSQNATVATPLPQPSTQPVTPDPIKAYLAMKQEMDSATTLEQYGQVHTKYASADALARIQALNAQIAQVPEDQKSGFLQFYQGYKSSDFALVTKEVSGNKVVLSITLKSGKAVGTVNLVLENSIWKLQLESWKVLSF